MARAWLEAPFPYWGRLRRLAAHTGAGLEESKGLIRRTFVFHGGDNSIAAVWAEIQRLKMEAEQSSE